MTRSSFCAALAACALAAFPAAAQPAPVEPEAMEGVAAIVNDQPISTYDVRQRMFLILASTGVEANDQIWRGVQAQAISSLINETIQLQEAAKYEVTVDQAEIDAAIEDIARQTNATRDQVINDLRTAGVDPITLEQQLRAEIAWSVLIRGLYLSRLRVSDDQIDDALERLAESAAEPQFELSEILIGTPINADQSQVRARVEAVFQALTVQRVPFPNVALQYSDSPSRAQGGDVGWVRASELPAEVLSELRRTRPGMVTQPVLTQDGVYIMALRNVRSAQDAQRIALMQVLIPVSADAEDPERLRDENARALQRFARRLDGCDDVENEAGRLEDAIVSDFGQLAPSDLTPEYRDAVGRVSIGDASEPLQTNGGTLSFVVCERGFADGEVLPSRDQVENRLLDQQLQLASRRLLRDLRSEATIETRLSR